MRSWKLLGMCAVLGGVAWGSYQAGLRATDRTAVTVVPAQAPLQELIPLPGPGRQFPGSQPQPGQGEECEARVYLFFNGRFYEMRPGPGLGPDGRPGAPQELIPLQPVPGPGQPSPAPPAPRGNNPFLPPLPPGPRF
ncbi:hypothetical protein HRbin32_00020 [bacterium HR32]|jgi:hypothetical protein|nr:hypothetical protein HRbin32_00020 [bacterium HR32]